MNAKRILIALMCLTIGLGIQAEESKELNKLLKAVRKVTNREKSGDKEVAEAEKALQLVIEKHPEEAGKAHVYFADIYVFSKNKELHDETKALKLYRQSIKELAPDDKLLGFACNRMGIFFQEGKVVPQNFDSAYVYFEKAQEIDKKYIGGYAQLIQLGLGTNADPAYALTCYMEGIAAGVDCYMNATNLCYVFDQELKGTLDKEGKDLYDVYFAKSLEGDNPLALQYLKKAADRKYLPAMADLGTVLFSGSLGEQDKVAGLDYLKQAAEAGFTTAWHNWATNSYLYKNNDGKGHSINESMQFYRESMPGYEKAATLGFPPSQSALANMYFIGLGVEPDMDKAYVYAKAAKDQGDKLGDEDQWNLWGLSPILIHAANQTILDKVIEPGHKSTHLVKRKLSTQKKQELDAEAAKLPTLKQYVTRLLNRFATTATLTLGPKATTSSEKEQQVGKPVAGASAANADFYQTRYNKFGRQVRKALSGESVDRDLIASYQATMKKIAQEAADKGFTIERNEWETK